MNINVELKNKGQRWSTISHRRRNVNNLPGVKRTKCCRKASEMILQAIEGKRLLSVKERLSHLSKRLDLSKRVSHLDEH